MRNIVRTAVETISRNASSPSTRPRPTWARTNENSPICARVIALARAEVPGTPKTRSAAHATSVLPTITAARVDRTSPACAAIQPGSASIPTDAKKSVTSSVRRAETSARIWSAKGDSASSIPATKAPQRGRDPQRVAGQGRADRRDDRQEDRELAVAAQRAAAQDARRDVTEQHEERRDQHRSQTQGAPELQQPGPRVVALGQHAEQQHQRHDRDVLDEQHAQGVPSVDALHLAARGQRAQHAGRARQRDDRARRQRRRDVVAEEHEHARAHAEGREDLRRSPPEARGAHRAQARPGELEPDREEQERDPQLGERLDLGTAGDPPERGGSEQGAGEEGSRGSRSAPAARTARRARGSRRAGSSRPSGGPRCSRHGHPYDSPERRSFRNAPPPGFPGPTAVTPKPRGR